MLDMLRRIIFPTSTPTQAPPPAPTVDADQYNAGICELDRLIGQAQQAKRHATASRDPVTGLVRGDYQRRRSAPARVRRKGTGIE